MTKFAETGSRYSADYGYGYSSFDTAVEPLPDPAPARIAAEREPQPA